MLGLSSKAQAFIRMILALPQQRQLHLRLLQSQQRHLLIN
jgi:hypothetical protein